MIFCEPFAGSAAISYALLGAKPPISYLGNKQGYSSAILDALGLSRHRPPVGIVLGEIGPMAAVHACLGGATGISAEGVGAWVLANRWSFSGRGVEHGYGGPGCQVRTDRAAWTTEDRDRALSAENTAATLLTSHPSAAEVAAIIRGWAGEEPRPLWERLRREGWPSLMPVAGGRWLGPVPVEEVAGLLSSAWLSYAQEAGGAFRATAGGAWPDRPPEVSSVAARVGALPAFPPLAVWQGSADALALPADLRGWVIYADPPYAGTTKYPSGDCDRATVLRLAQGWSDRGAVVAVSEAVPLPLEGWHHVEIGHARKGQKRTFGHTNEWITMNRPPVHRPARGQVALFG